MSNEVHFGLMFSQCSNYHRARVGRGPPTSLNGPPTCRKSRGPKGAAFGPPTCADPGGPIRPWPPLKLAERIMTATVNLWKSTGFGLPIDVGYGFGTPTKKYIIKPEK